MSGTTERVHRSSWAVAVHSAPVAQIVEGYADQPDFGVKDAVARTDLTAHGLVPFFEASWIYHSPLSGGIPGGWEVITTPEALLKWEAA